MDNLKRNIWTDKRILIIGADGVLGSRIREQLETLGAIVVGTSRRPADPISTSRIFLDICKNNEIDKFNSYDLAIFLAGITLIQACETDPVGTNSINVVATLKILKTLNDLGVRTIFLSTNHVFNPSLNYPKVSDSIEPRNQYAIQKVEVEKIILAELQNVVVIRLTKFFDLESSLIRNWNWQLKSGQSIVAFKDVCVSFILIGELIDSFEQTLNLSDHRLFHLGGAIQETYYDFSLRYFGKQGLSSSKIIGKYKYFGEIEYNSLSTNIPK